MQDCPKGYVSQMIPCKAFEIPSQTAPVFQKFLSNQALGIGTHFEVS